MALHLLDALVDAASLDSKKDSHTHSSSKSVSGPSQVPEDAQLADLKRKFKDVLRAYWRQHKNTHEGEDTEQYEVAYRIANGIFLLYWDKPHYAALRNDKNEILNYFVKHIQLSKTREGQSANPFVRNSYGKSGHRNEQGSAQDSEVLKYPREEESALSTAPRRRPDPQFPSNPDIDNLQRDHQPRHIIPRNAETLKLIRDAIPEAQIPSTLLVDGIPSMISETAAKNEIARILQTQFGLQAAISTLQANEMFYKVLLAGPEEAELLAGQTIRVKFPGYQNLHNLYRAPPKSFNAKRLGLGTTSKKRKSDEVEDDGSAKKKIKLADANPEEESPVPFPGGTIDLNGVAAPHILTPSIPLSMGNYTFPPAGGFVLNPHPFAAYPVPHHTISPHDADQFVVERILQQRWVQNKVQYLLKLRGETQSIKVWIFDEDIFSEFDSNRRQANLLKAYQTGKYPEADQLPEIEQVLGIKMHAGNLMFYVKWANSNVFAFVPSSIVNRIAPQKVIQYYESKLSFESNGNPTIVDSSNNSSSNTTSNNTSNNSPSNASNSTSNTTSNNTSAAMEISTPTTVHSPSTEIQSMVTSKPASTPQNAPTSTPTSETAAIESVLPAV